MLLQHRHQPAQHGHRQRLGRLLDLDHLENGGSARGSFSKYFLYSAQVVAAMVRISPRARGGLQQVGRIVLALRAAGADQRVRSSMNMMIGVWDVFTSSMTDFRPISRTRP